MKLLENVTEPLVPSRVKIFTEILDKMPRLATIEVDGVDSSRKMLFYAHLFPALRFYMSTEVVDDYESYLIVEKFPLQVSKREELLQILKSKNFEKKLENEQDSLELEEALADPQFSPFVPSDIASDPIELIKKVCHMDGHSQRMKKILRSIALGIPGDSFPHTNFTPPRVFICSREDRSIAPKNIVADLIASGTRNFSRKNDSEGFCRLALEDTLDFENSKETIIALREENVNHPELNRWLTCETTLLKDCPLRKAKQKQLFSLSSHQKWTLNEILSNLPRSIDSKVAIFMLEAARIATDGKLFEKIVDVLKEKASKIALDSEDEEEKSILEAFLQFAEQKLKVLSFSKDFFTK